MGRVESRRLRLKLLVIAGKKVRRLLIAQSLAVPLCLFYKSPKGATGEGAKIASRPISLAHKMCLEVNFQK